MKSKVSIISLGTALLVTLVLTGCATAGGKSTAQVTTENKYIRFDHLQNTAEPTDLKKSDTVAMSCAKCTTVSVRPPSIQTPTRRLSSYRSSWGFSNPHRFASGAFAASEPVHYCPGCKSTITTTGTGQDKKETVKHTCSLQSEGSGSCCAIKPGA